MSISEKAEKLLEAYYKARYMYDVYEGRELKRYEQARDNLYDYMAKLEEGF